MSARLAGICFSDNLSGFHESDDLIVRIPSSIATRDQLFDILSQELSLPSYFGRNWDALSECLRDLSWIDRRRVIIVHEGLPDLDSATLGSYLDLLVECIGDWTADDEHELLAVFPRHAEAEIRGILRGKP